MTKCAKTTFWHLFWHTSSFFNIYIYFSSCFVAIRHVFGTFLFPKKHYCLKITWKCQISACLESSGHKKWLVQRQWTPKNCFLGILA